MRARASGRSGSRSFREKNNLARATALEADPQRARCRCIGIPFAVKDNFDVEGLPTTAACPAFAHDATQTATVVQKLLDAGAILIGKTNMDQFATGLVGTRTPYGICSSVFDAEYISGGSSSGSAVAVATRPGELFAGHGYGRLGARARGLQQLVGLKPTRGWLSTHGLLPACRTLDCVSIFAETCADAARVFSVARGFDAADPYSRAPAPGQGAAPWSATAEFRFGVPRRNWSSLATMPPQRYIAAAVDALAMLGGAPVEFDYEPFREAASLLYKGPWVAERLAAIKEFLAGDPEAVDPTVGAIIRGGAKFSAVDAFEAAYALEALRRETEAVWEQADFLLLPTAPTHYTIEQVQAAPVELNAKLGYYTNFVNLLDLAAVAVPAGFKPNGLPFGVSLIGKAFTDDGLLRIADRLHRSARDNAGRVARANLQQHRHCACDCRSRWMHFDGRGWRASRPGSR